MIKLAVFSVLVVMLGICFKKDNHEYQLIISLVAGLFIMGASVDFIKSGLATINELISVTSINNDYLKLILKCIGISYIGEFSSSLCKDAGNQSIAEQIEMASKLLIFAMGIPVMKDVLYLLNSFAGG